MGYGHAYGAAKVHELRQQVESHLRTLRRDHPEVFEQEIEALDQVEALIAEQRYAAAELLLQQVDPDAT